MTRQLSARRIGYIHVMEPPDADLQTGTVEIEYTTRTLRPLFDGTVITNGGYDKPKAEAAIDDGLADLVSFGVPFLANPDLPDRFLKSAPLNKPDHATFYGGGAHGYTDCPRLSSLQDVTQVGSAS